MGCSVYNTVWVTFDVLSKFTRWQFLSHSGRLLSVT